jgi:hypothetical protein
LNFLSAMQTADLLEHCTSVGKILVGLHSSLEAKLLAASHGWSNRNGRTRRTP